MKKIFSLAILFVLTLTLMAVPAMADTFYTFSFATNGVTLGSTGVTGSGIVGVNGNVIDFLSGSLTTSDLGKTGLMTLDPVNTFGSDNVFTDYPNYLTVMGMSFDAGGTTYNIYNFDTLTNTGGQPYQPTGCSFSGLCITAQTNGIPSDQIISGNFAPTADPSAVPEPASLMLLGSGLLGLAGAARRRFLKA